MKRIRSVLAGHGGASAGQRGTILIDTLVALALLGLLGGAFLSALTTSAHTAAITNQMTIMDNLARAQLEYTKNSAYITGSPDVTTYPCLSDPNNPDAIAMPAGYSLSVLGHALDQPDDGIQLITVTVQDGSSSLVVNDYKVNR